MQPHVSPWLDILDESVFAFILAGNLVNFKCSGIGNYIHHLVWCTVHSAQSPYGCGVLFI